MPHLAPRVARRDDGGRESERGIAAAVGSSSAVRARCPDARGVRRPREEMELTADWLLPWREEAGQGQGEPRSATLGLSAVFSNGTELIYLFTNSPFAPDVQPVHALPQCLRELLLFEPIVAVRFTEGCFKSLRPEEWQEMVAYKEPASAALQTLSSALESVCSADLEGGGGLDEDDEGNRTSSEEADDPLDPGNDVDDLGSDVDDDSCGDGLQEDLLIHGSSS